LILRRPAPHNSQLPLSVADPVTAARRAALETLGRVGRGELLDRALPRAAEGLDPRDHAWIQELVYGSVRLRGRIDHILGAFVRAGLSSLDPPVLDVLRLGTYQLLEMGSVPAYAAVSQSVELVRSAGAPRAAGLVNGVLQSVRRGRESVRFPDLESDPVGHLTSWGSHPLWLVLRWVDRWGAEEASRLVDANNPRPELYLRPAGVTSAEAIERLAASGISAELVPLFPDSVRIVPPTSPLEALAAVPGVVQDPAAAMVTRYADFPADATLVDLASAPGGKTVGLADGARFLAASDPSLGKLRRVKANVERAGFAGRVGLVVADGLHPPFRQVDGVLLDAPCTGTGTLRRHPDGRWRVTEHDLAALADLQRRLLDSAADLVRPMGHLVYSTCSLEPEENESQVVSFLSRHPDFEIEAPSTPIDGTMLADGFLSVLPQRQGVDGAFAARLVRRA
jgi:16S rRNA (cytosine967-C5)-methyltransferase